jgi:hypothetical protein
VELNDYSSRFLAVLLRAFPEFGERVAAGPEVGCFTVKFPAPSGSTFWVATEDFDRITAGFDSHHVHFGGWAESVDAQDFDNAVEYIRRLMSGEYLVAVWSRDGVFAGSVTLARGSAAAVGERRRAGPCGQGLVSTSEVKARRTRRFPGPLSNASFPDRLAVCAAGELFRSAVEARPLIST